MKYVYTLISIGLYLFAQAQDLVKIAPFGQENCFDFMTQAYRGNIMAVRTLDGVPYKIKLNKDEQIEWMVIDSSETLYSMFASGDLIGAYGSEGKTIVTCRDRYGVLKWKKELQPKGYHFDVLEINDDEFVLGLGTGTRSYLYRMNRKGEIIWTADFEPSINWSKGSNRQLFLAKDGIVAAPFDWVTSQVFFTQLDLEGNVNGQTQLEIYNGEGDMEIHQGQDDFFTVMGTSVRDPSSGNGLHVGITTLDSTLKVVNQTEQNFFDCFYDYSIQSIGNFTILEVEDTLIYSCLGSYLDPKDWEEQTSFFVLSPGQINCQYHRLEFPWIRWPHCGDFRLHANYLKVQRGSGEFLVSLTRDDDLGIFTHLVNYDPSKYFAASNMYVSLHTLEQPPVDDRFFKHWIFSPPGWSLSFSSDRADFEFVQYGWPRDLQLNTGIYGYDHDKEITDIQPKTQADFTIKLGDEPGLGVRASLPFWQDLDTNTLYLRYWNYGLPTSGQIIVRASTPLKCHEADQTIDDTTWTVDLGQIQPFGFYERQLTLGSDEPVMGELTLDVTIFSPDQASESLRPDLHHCVLTTQAVSSTSPQWQVHSSAGSSRFFQSGERVRYQLAWRNDSDSIVRDLQILSELSQAILPTFMLEGASHPVDVRAHNSRSLDFSLPGVSFEPGEIFFVGFSVLPGGGCGSVFSNQVIHLVDYQRQDTLRLDIPMRSVGVVKEIDTTVAVGHYFLGLEIRGDTVVKDTIMGMGLCDTVRIYHVVSTSTPTSDPNHSSVKVWPNPFHNFIHVDPGQADLRNVRLVDVHGRNVAWSKGPNNQINISAPAHAGVYVLYLELSDGRVVLGRVLKL